MSGSAQRLVVIDGVIRVIQVSWMTLVIFFLPPVQWRVDPGVVVIGKPAVVVVGHDVHEVENSAYSGHIVGHVNDGFARGQGSSKQHVVVMQDLPQLFYNFAKILLVSVRIGALS